MFTLPYITDEEWNNTISDVGVIAFFQGVPLGEITFNHFAFGGSKLMKRDEIKGVINRDTNIKYYFSDTCMDKIDTSKFTFEETFMNEREAAKHGYYPLSCKN